MRDRISCSVYSTAALFNIAAALGLLACDGGCPEGTTLKGGVCAKLREGGESSGNVAEAGPQGNGVMGATGGNQSIAALDAGRTANSAGPQVAGTGTSKGAVIMSSAGVAGVAANSSTPAQSGTGAQQSQQPVTAPAAGSAAPNAEPMAGGSGGTCSPAEETCDNVDNDCDSKVDEDVAPVPCGPDKGICRPGTIQCHSGKWDDPNTQCQGAVGPSAMGEQCDAQLLDENCDGVANENCACTEGQTMPCSTGRYSCKEGTVACVNGRFSTQCDGEVKGSAEVCDGADNDCDLVPDNGGDALCTKGQHCAGAAKCVQCTDKSHCGGMSTDCKDGVCDSNHQCVTQNHADHTPCTASGSSGVCSAGSCVAGCLDDSDCKNSSAKYCDQAQRKCVSCLADSQCPSGQSCDSNRCVATCGNGRTDSNESCDQSDSSKWDQYSCDDRCNRRYIYTACRTVSANSSECNGGPCVGSSSGNRCLTTGGCPSVQPAQAPTCSYGSGIGGVCLGGFCWIKCNSDSDCPNPTHCTTMMLMSGTYSTCR